MTWLLTQMWAVLGIAGLLGLLFGLGIRGLMLRGRMRRAEVERGLIATELEQARTEIEGLYAAQRKLGVSATANPELEAELNRRIADLERELASARTSAPAAAGPTPIGGVSAASATQDTGTLEWRNRYLESRVRSLEARLEAGEPAETAPAGEPLSPAAPATAAASVDAAKLAWQNDYLRMRLRAFESEAGLAPSDVPDTPPAAGTDTPAPLTTTAPAPAPAPVTDDGRETPDEELARLRWRNRYLEGRLAYLEEERSKEAAPESAVDAGFGAVTQTISPSDADTQAIETATSPVPEAPDTSLVDITDSEPAPTSPDAFNPETAPPVETDPVTEPSPASFDPQPAEPAIHLADEIAAGLDTPGEEAVGFEEPVQPTGLDAPRNGQGDELTAIEGIGPRIQEVLNSIGIYHLDQIASWNSGNVAWIDKFLAFDGRIAREDWVGQAHRLIGESAMNPA